MTLAARELCVAGRLAGVSVELRAGELTAICGPNGAGKSSLLQCLAGLLEPGSGEIALGEMPLAMVRAKARAQAIGYLAQHDEVAWDLAVEALVALGRLPHGDAGEAEVAAALAALDLTALAHRRVSTLSGGERARALLARVLAGTPDWILADEPLAPLDLAHQLALLSHLRTAARGGAGVVIALHDLALAMNHADRAVVLHMGKVVADAAPEQALDPRTIARAWGVDVRWLGEPGARALVAR